MLFPRLLCIAFLCLCLDAAAQNDLYDFFKPKPPSGTDTNYYPFYNGVQMIEIDNFRNWEADIAYHEMVHPRALSWSMLIPGPFANVYLFRNRSGEIVKAFNTDQSLEELTKVFSKIPLDQKSGSISHRLMGGFHTGKYYSGWFDYRSREIEFNGYYLVYDTAHGNPLGYLMGEKIHGLKAGLIDSFGNYFLPAEYSEILPVNNNILVSKDGRCGVMDKKKQYIVPMEYDAYNNRYDEIVFYRGEKIGLVYSAKKNKVFPVDGLDYIDMESINHMRQNPQPNRESSLVHFRKGDMMGLMDTNYKVVTPAVYDAIMWCAQGRMVCCRDKKFGYLDAKGKEVIPCMYTYAEYFRQDAGIVQHEGKFRNIDRNGKLLPYTVPHNEWRITEPTPYNTIGDLRVVHTASGCGLVNAKDVFVVPPIYDDIQPMHTNEVVNGRISYSKEVFVARRFGKSGIVDVSGKVRLPFGYESIGDYETPNGFRIVQTGYGQFGVINSRFELVAPCIYQSVDVNDKANYFIVRQGDKTGTLDTTGKPVIPVIYDHINPFGNGCASAQKDSLFGFIDMKGTVVIPFAYENVYGHFNNGLCAVMQQGKWGFIDTAGTMVIKPQYESIRLFESELTGVEVNGKWGFIDRTGKLVVGYQYDAVGHDWYRDGTCEVTRKGKIGFINTKGEEVIPCEYTQSWGFSPEKGHSLEKGGVRMWVKVKE